MGVAICGRCNTPCCSLGSQDCVGANGLVAAKVDHPIAAHKRRLVGAPRAEGGGWRVGRGLGRRHGSGVGHGRALRVVLAQPRMLQQCAPACRAGGGNVQQQAQAGHPPQPQDVAACSTIVLAAGLPAAAGAAAAARVRRRQPRGARADCQCGRTACFTPPPLLKARRCPRTKPWRQSPLWVDGAGRVIETCG